MILYCCYIKIPICLNTNYPLDILAMVQKQPNTNLQENLCKLFTNLIEAGTTALTVDADILHWEDEVLLRIGVECETDDNGVLRGIARQCKYTIEANTDLSFDYRLASYPPSAMSQVPIYISKEATGSHHLRFSEPIDLSSPILPSYLE